jgi:hypothetical protein
MFYRVIKKEDGLLSIYDFDELQDAICWVKQESALDENRMFPVEYEYEISEIGTI